MCQNRGWKTSSAPSTWKRSLEANEVGKICQIQSRNSHWWKQQELYKLDKHFQLSPNIPKMLGAPSYRQSNEDAEDVFFPHHFDHLHTFLQSCLIWGPEHTSLRWLLLCLEPGPKRSFEKMHFDRWLFVWVRQEGRPKDHGWRGASESLQPQEKKPPCKFSFETELVAFWWCYHVLPLMVVVLTSSNCVWTTTFPHLRFPDVQHCFNKEQEKHQQYFQKATSLIWSANDGKRLVPGDADGGFIDKAGKENRSILAQNFVWKNHISWAFKTHKILQMVSDFPMFPSFP